MLFVFIGYVISALVNYLKRTEKKDETEITIIEETEPSDSYEYNQFS
jgi:hypothetical protein